MRKPGILWLCVGLMLAASCDSKTGSSDEGPKVDRMLVVTTEGLREAATTYLDYRKSVGFEGELVTTDELLERYDSASLTDAVFEGVRRFEDRAPGNRELFVLFIGDADESDPDNPAFVPVAPGGGGFVGDSPYGDLDGDDVPELHMGRIPFREASEVLAYLDRVRAHESGYVPGPWNKTLRVLGGEGGFGSDVDQIFETVAYEVFDQMSYDFDVSMTYALSSSPFFLPTAQWDAQYVEDYNGGALGVIYIGHTKGSVPDGSMTVPARRGLLGFLSCGDGDYQSGFYGSLAEGLISLDKGPLVTLAATDWSHPYGNALLAREFGHALMNLREPTYGAIVTAAKYNIKYRIDDLRAMIDAFAEPYLDEPIADLVQMVIVEYNLLGDPAAAVMLPPGRVEFDPPEGEIRCGEPFTATGSVSVDPSGEMAMTSGEVTVTLEVERAVIIGDLTPIDENNPDPAVCQENHRIANDKVVVSATSEVSGGRFSATLEVPAGQSPVRYYLKGFAENGSLDAMGSLQVALDRASCR